MKVRLKGVHATLDGEYELASPWTTRDWRTIKKQSGVRPAEVVDAIRMRDVDFMVALAMNGLRQAGKGDVPVEIFDDAEAAAIDLILDDETEEGDARPPDGTPPTGDDSASASEPES